ncbi:MAG: RNA polymerase factor sigma-54 [Gemmataceae bacterium]|nr:RNA polymerase factor sigma-54 [Gemmataceae bacterium]
MAQLGMSMNLQTVQRPELRLGPRMIQAMKILQLPIMELSERIEQELEENPVLERVDLSETAEDEEPAPSADDDFDPDGPLVIDDDSALDFSRLEALNRDWEDHFNEEHRPSRNSVEEESERKHDAMQNMPSRPPSLHDYLLEQIAFLDVDAEFADLLRYVVSHIAENGWLGSYSSVDEEAKNGSRRKPQVVWVPLTIEELVRNYPRVVSREQMESALLTVQSLDPPGVGARDLKECLLLQVEDDTPHADLVRLLIQNHLDDVNHNRLPVIERKTGHSLEAIKSAIEVLRGLNPNPGSQFAAKATHYVVPDLIVERNHKGEYEVRLTDDWLPEVRISRRYLEMARQKGLDRKTKEYLRAKIHSAEWLTDAIQQRRNTLLKVTKAIIEHQRPFLDLGPDHIKPLKMQQIADQVHVHVTTVSRAVDDKWVQTPRGLFPLKRFFVGGKENQITGEDVAYETIKTKLLELIAAEDKANPLSDDELVKRLNAAGYPVKRRTVTKYRMMLDIPSSRQRKEWAR